MSMSIMKRLMNSSRSAQHVIPLSTYSTPLVPDSNWAATDFLLGAGMVIIQPSSRQIVIVHDPPSGAYFLPKGRKDIGESLEQTALREAYEEVVCSFYVRCIDLRFPSQVIVSRFFRYIRERMRRPLLKTYKPVQGLRLSRFIPQ